MTDKATPEAVESFKKYKQQLIDKKDSIYNQTTKHPEKSRCFFIPKFNKTEKTKKLRRP